MWPQRDTTALCYRKVRGLAACHPKANKQATLVERKICFPGITQGSGFLFLCAQHMFLQQEEGQPGVSGRAPRSPPGCLPPNLPSGPLASRCSSADFLPLSLKNTQMSGALVNYTHSVIVDIFASKDQNWETSLAIQWLRLHFPMQGVQVWSLVEELRSQNVKQKQYC